MNTIPIIFAIDNNVVMQCGVAITSLLINASEETLYDINIIYEGARLSKSNMDCLADKFTSCKQMSLHFVEINGDFSAMPLSGAHSSVALYYRLAIPSMFPQFDKVIYADVDLVFQRDLTELYFQALNNGEWIAAVPDLAIDDKFYFESPLPATIGKSVQNYFNSGFLVMNLKAMREHNVEALFKEHCKIKYGQNDQDVLNVVCNGKTEFLPCIYNFQPNHFANYMWGRKAAKVDFSELFKHGTLHYTGPKKPWISLECVAADAWWHYYRMSPFYDDRVYFKRQFDQIESFRNDFRNKTNKQLLIRAMVNIKHKLFGK